MTIEPTFALPVFEDSREGYTLLNEKLLAFIWRLRLYDFTMPLLTISGRALKVISCGTENKNSGPDFTEARLVINGVEWVGNVEIHTRASHWHNHKHERDPAYNNVILHVVYEHDRDIVFEDGRVLEVLELKKYLTNAHLTTLKDVCLANTAIACQTHLKAVSTLTMKNLVDRMAITRLADKSGLILEQLSLCRGDWDEVGYRLLCKSMGFKVNSPAFEMLASRLSYRLLAKYCHNPLSVEALLFGTAGLLPDEVHDEYIAALRTEYSFLKTKYNLQPLDKFTWKFLRMRPAGFPTMRIAQLAAFILTSPRPFNLVLQEDAGIIRDLLGRLQVNNYWNTHYMPGRKTNWHAAGPGRASIDNLLINMVAPLLYAYGSATRQERYKEKAMDILDGLKPEENHIVALFTQLGVPVRNAAETQGLLQLYNTQCKHKLCTRCAVLADLLSGK